MLSIGIDIGGTKIAAGIVRDGKVIKRIVVPTEAGKGKEHILGTLRQLIAELSAGKRLPVGIGVPGTYHGTKAVHLPHVAALDGVDLKTALGRPVTLENDARCFLLAEARYGAAKGVKNAVGVTIGTGVGGAIMIDGRIYRGNGAAGEIGHTMFGAQEWEAVISGSAIVARHIACGGTEGQVSEVWRAVSVEAQATRDETIMLMAQFMRNIILTFDPQVIVLGGGVSNAPVAMPVNGRLQALGCKPLLRQAKLADAGIIGAAMLCQGSRSII